MAHVKLQRKINSIEEELSELQNNRLQNSLGTKLAITYGSRIVIGIVLFLFSLYYRQSPVLYLSEKFDMFPISRFISYPNECNAVSLPIWIICCVCIARLVKGD